MRRLARIDFAILLFACAAAQPASSGATPTPGKGMVLAGLPDLILEGPVVSEQGNGAETHTYTVRNGGDADAHATRLRLRCEVVHIEYLGDGCVPKPVSKSSQNETLFADVPPLKKGAAVQVILHPVRIHKHGSLGDIGDPLYRVKFTADLDPDATLTESSRANNHLERTEENFSGLVPISAAPKGKVLPPPTTPAK